MDQILGGLNAPQREAVETLSGPLLVLAGAGSGKTKVLTHRIANLIAHGVRPHQILAVTFTNKAAKEMRERLWKLLANGNNKDSLPSETAFFDGKPIRSFDVGNFSPEKCPKSFMPYMGTFHGICVRLLHIEYQAAGIDRNFTIYDTDDQLTLIRRIMREMHLTGDKSLTPKGILSAISHYQNLGLTPKEATKEAVYPNQKRTAELYAAYTREKIAASALDFDDLLTRTANLLQENAEVRAKWQQRFQHILIDEYQDTNAVQYRLIKYLVNEQRNICVVGDDWQSIYSWRGADFTNILNFERDFPGAKVIKLEQNYRSTGNILAASQKIINQNKTRTEKTLFTEAGQGSPITIEGLQDESAEASYVARQIVRLRASGRSFSDFAILYRTNAQSSAFEKAFIEAHIPYKIIGGVRFYDRKEVKDVIALLHLVVNPRDLVSFERVVKNVLAGVGQASLDKIFAHLEAHPELTLADLADWAPEVVSGRAKAATLKLGQTLSTLRANLRSEEPLLPAAIVEHLVKTFDFASLLRSDTPDGAERMQNLEVLASNASAYETLDDFLADAALLSSADDLPMTREQQLAATAEGQPVTPTGKPKSTGDEAVSLMTMHAAKGLEFPVVFIVGMEEGLFPSSRAADSESDLEEERRLAYVGMTRAMQDLFLTFAGSRFSFGGRTYQMPSQFLTELGYNPYGSADYQDPADAAAGSFTTTSRFQTGPQGYQARNFGLLGGDPDGEFGRPTSSPNLNPAQSTLDPDFNDFDNLDQDYDPFPEDLPIFEG